MLAAICISKLNKIMDEIEKVISKFESLKNTIGWIASLFAIFILLVIFFLWKYLTKVIERSAEETSEKTIRKFQSQIDKEISEHSVKFSTKHQKQIDAVHEIYIRFQNLFKIMDFMYHGDKYYQELNPHKEVASLIEYRTDFIQVYGLHKIVLPRDICSKIDNLIPSIEEFIDTYKSGLFPEGAQPEEHDEDNYSGEPKLYLAGIWRQGAFDEVLKKLEQVRVDIEEEFRKLYGT